MTRTERSASLKAVMKDRSESKNTHDKSVRKNGAGSHGWGNLADERNLEYDAMVDEFDNDEDSSPATAKKPEMGRSGSMSDEEREGAKQFRKNALKGDGIDLAAIARTSSAVSGSPPNKVPVAIANGAETAV